MQYVERMKNCYNAVDGTFNDAINADIDKSISPVKVLRYHLIKNAFIKNQHAGNIRLKSTTPPNEENLKTNITIDKPFMNDYFPPILAVPDFISGIDCILPLNSPLTGGIQL